MEWQDFPASDGSAVWKDSEGNVVADQSGWGSQGVGGGMYDSFFGALVKTGEVLATGIPRIIDAKANMMRAENARPVVYRNGKPYFIDPDAARYGYGIGGASAFGGSNGLILLALAGAAVFLLAKD